MWQEARNYGGQQENSKIGKWMCLSFTLFRGRYVQRGRWGVSRVASPGAAGEDGSAASKQAAGPRRHHHKASPDIINTMDVDLFIKTFWLLLLFTLAAWPPRPSTHGPSPFSMQATHLSLDDLSTTLSSGLSAAVDHYVDLRCPHVPLY